MFMSLCDQRQTFSKVKRMRRDDMYTPFISLYCSSVASSRLRSHSCEVNFYYRYPLAIW